MTLASDISTTSTSLSDIKNAIIAKGVTPSGNITTYAAAIADIPTGGGIGINREVKNGVYQMPTENFTFSLPNDATDIGNYGLYYAFYRSSSLTSVDLSSLTTVSGTYGLNYAFYSCTGLTNVSFPALTTTSFGSYTNQFSNMMRSTGTTVIHTIHFPSNMQSTISGLSGYPLFGGTSGYVVLSFDLPATS